MTSLGDVYVDVHGRTESLERDIKDLGNSSSVKKAGDTGGKNFAAGFESGSKKGLRRFSRTFDREVSGALKSVPEVAESAGEGLAGVARGAASFGRMGKLMGPAGVVIIGALAGIVAMAGPAVAALGGIVLALGASVGAAAGAGVAFGALASIYVKKTLEMHKAGQTLTASQKQFISSLNYLKEAFTKFSQVNGGALLNPLAAGMKLLESILSSGQLSALVGDLSVRFTNLLNQLRDSGQIQKFLGFLKEFGGPALTTGAQILGQFGKALGQIFGAGGAAAFGQVLLDGLNSKLQQFNNWLQYGGGTEKFKQFFEWVRVNGPVIWNAIVQIVKNVVKFIQFMEPAAMAAWRAVGMIAGGFNAVWDSIAPVRGALTGILGLLETIARFLSGMKMDIDVSAAQNTINRFGNWLNSLGWRGSFDIDIGPALSRIQEFANKASPILAKVLSTFNMVRRAMNQSRVRVPGNTLSASAADRMYEIANASGGGVRALNMSGFGSGGGAQKEDEEDKKEKKKQRKAIADLRPVLRAIGQTTDQYRSAMESFINSLHETGKKDAVRIGQTFYARMQPFLKGLDAARDTITKFWETTKRVQDAMVARANIFASNTGRKDFQSILLELSKARTQTRDFATTLQQLRGLGLNDTMLQQFAEAGPDALGKAQSIVAAGASGIAQLNKLTTDISKFGEIAGRETAAGALKAGQQTALGFIQGLTAQRAQLQKILDAAAISMGNQIAAVLKGSKSHVIGSLDHFASGVRNYHGGLAKVGERGPELVRLPRGSDVYSNGESRRMMSSPVDNSTFVYSPVFTGPTTSGGRLAQMEWTQKFATGAHRETLAGVPT